MCFECFGFSPKLLRNHPPLASRTTAGHIPKWRSSDTQISRAVSNSLMCGFQRYKEDDSPIKFRNPKKVFVRCQPVRELILGDCLQRHPLCGTIPVDGSRVGSDSLVCKEMQKVTTQWTTKGAAITVALKANCASREIR